MAVYIDPPRWPAHGTLFSHLVSDVSYVELHQYAESIGLSQRAFDQDHYDVPAEYYERALAIGALPVEGRQLIGVLRSSGLRVPARERVQRLAPELSNRWAKNAPGQDELGTELLSRWREKHRRYHNLTHLHKCLGALDVLAEAGWRGEVPLPVEYAAWFHDAVYNGVAGEDERASGQLAAERLTGAMGEEVQRLVLLTQHHEAAPEDDAGSMLVDADLAILGAPRPRYRRYVAQVRDEYRAASDDEWLAGRSAVLESFLDRGSIYTTREAKQLWEERARSNIASELQSLQSAGGVAVRVCSPPRR